MREISKAPEITLPEIPMDFWTKPFWNAATRSELILPRCGACRAHRWPPGPFCPECRSQDVEWRAAGRASLYSYTIVRQRTASEDAPRIVVPGLVEFENTNGVRIVAAIVDTPLDALVIGAPLTLGWRTLKDTQVPVFSIREES